MQGKVHPQASHLDAFAQAHVDQMAAHITAEHRWVVDPADAHDRGKLIAAHQVAHQFNIICYLPYVPLQGGAR